MFLMLWRQFEGDFRGVVKQWLISRDIHENQNLDIILTLEPENAIL